MSQRITESAAEEFCLEVLEAQGYRFVSPEELDRKEPSTVIRPPHSPQPAGPFRRLDENPISFQTRDEGRGGVSPGGRFEPKDEWRPVRDSNPCCRRERAES